MLSIRPRRIEDLAACVPLLARVHAQDGYPVNWPADPVAWLSPRYVHTGWVAESTDGPAARITGHVLLCAAGDEHPARLLHERTGQPVERIAVVSRLFVDPEHQGGPAGAALMRTAMSYAHERGWQVVLGVLAGRHMKAQRFYERRGWRGLGTVDFTLSDGRIVPMHCYAEPDMPV